MATAVSILEVPDCPVNAAKDSEELLNLLLFHGRFAIVNVIISRLLFLCPT
ncbi:unnamed protein product [Prunus armeniaca]|uniref:Uncharacterized protein n=1 Tax=Prunus armeniaca TaxID=36596 RepID=A0A6J5WBF0_PRUAR|nr:unnamed protein product [Prunus armeniaca]